MEVDLNAYFLAGRWVQQGQLHWDQQGPEVRGQRTSGSNPSNPIIMYSIE